MPSISKAVLTGAMALGLLVGGCDFFKTDRYRLLSPHQVVAPPDRSPVSAILHSLSPADQHEELVPNATFPRPEDYVPTERDYIIGPTDVVRVSIMDLIEDGIESHYERQVSDTGFVDLPLLERRIRAEGRTTEQFKAAIVRAYREANILLDPQVSVVLVAKRQAVFSVLGAVDAPSTYNILRKDMRLLEGLALAGGVLQTRIRYIYVIRQTDRGVAARPEEAPEEPALPELPEIPEEAETRPETQPEPGKRLEDRLKEIEDILGGEGPAGPEEPETPAPSQMLRLSDSGEAPGADGPGAPAGPRKKSKWVYTDERWVRVPTEEVPATGPATRGAPPRRKPETRELPVAEAGREDPFGWARLAHRRMARIIAINLDKLERGDPRMNIVIRDHDVIYVPPLEVGEFYVMGEVQRPGVYSLTGRDVTIKMALAAAGNLSPLAMPENAILIRRIGKNQEQIVPVNIENIFHGDQPDIFLKPDDVLAVGTDVRTTFFAVIRNAFRMTYGFGFIYDRNFNEPVYPRLDSRRFTRW